MMKKTLPSRIDESLKSPHLSEVGVEISEAILDNSLSEDILKEIPGFKILYGLGKAYESYNDRLLINKLLVFFSSFKDVPIKDRKEQIDKINSDPKYRQKVGEKLIHIINQTEDRVKAELVGYFFLFFLLKKISYDQFLRFSRIANTLDIEMLSLLVGTNTTHWPLSEAGTFIALGLHTFSFEDKDLEVWESAGSSSEGTITALDEDAIITSEGKAFIKCLRESNFFSGDK